ncbi:MAG: asparagine synthase-related protein [Chitinophagaceae bacterium]
MNKPIAEVINLVPEGSQQVRGMTVEALREQMLRSSPEQFGSLAAGSFALVARDGQRVVLARSLDRPLRYFLAKVIDGPLLIVAERIDQIRDWMLARGMAAQFHPSYTRMVPAFHLTEIALVGCPDPNPQYLRFFDPPRGVLPADLDLLARHYVGALLDEVQQWLAGTDSREPLGVLFSGGIDSGAVLLALHHALLRSGQSPARLKAFCLRVGDGEDFQQADAFLRQVGLQMLLEPIEADPDALDPMRAVDVIEDYKPLDVECATVMLALLEGIRSRYPDWRQLVDGDGGDENLKDYPLEVDGELTIRSVVNNSLLYQEGWGVDAIKHSLTYTGGYSRACVRAYAPLQRHGFSGYSPFLAPAVMTVAEAIPFAELTQGSTERLYALKGELIARGFKQLLDIDFPVFEKRRFQHGATDESVFAKRFAYDEIDYRGQLLRRFAA